MARHLKKPSPARLHEVRAKDDVIVPVFWDLWRQAQRTKKIRTSTTAWRARGAADGADRTVPRARPPIGHGPAPFRRAEITQGQLRATV
jgi:hypothetical protein